MMQPAPDQIRAVLTACHVPENVLNAESFEWDRHNREWVIKAGWYRLHFGPPGRNKILDMFNARALDMATHIVEMPRIIDEDDPTAAFTQVYNWTVGMSDQERNVAWDAYFEEVERQQETGVVEYWRNELPFWGFVKGGQWTRHYATGVTKSKRVKYGKNKGDIQVYFETACGKEVRLDKVGWGDDKKPLCERCGTLAEGSTDG